MNGNPDVDLQFSPDFAARVFETADRLTRRRHIQRLAGMSVMCAGLAAALVWVGISAAPQGAAPNRNPTFASVSPSRVYKESGGRPAEPGSSGDALSWFFPDAQPLARYAAEDATDDSDSGGSAGSLFDPF
ncbi:MAG TPA: hypothetical protein VKR31_16835 [Rhizomicrobium sp.]|nr:hypothetical protein [Rhizomicrobium sp.]